RDAVACGGRQPSRRRDDPRALRRRAHRPGAVPRRTPGPPALPRAARGDVRLAGRDDRQGGAAGRPHRRGAGELSPAARPLEDQRHGPRHAGRGMGDPRRHREASLPRTLRLVLMADLLHDCALVIMAKAPCAGRVKTRLEPAVPPDALVALYRCLIEDTVALPRPARAPRVPFVGPRGDGDDIARWLDIGGVEQEGTGLAAGLASVFPRFLGNGCRRVIAFNGDTPHLPPDTLAGAFALLDRHDLVVGPT